MKGPVPGGSTTQSERAGISFTLLRRDIIQPTYATEPGSRVGLYEILAPLGAGGMGEVYRARDTALKRDVAIKVLPVDWSRDPDRLRRFELEVQAAALNHQHRFHLPGRRARRGALHR
jgi:serine/threonine protein kinase